MFDHVLKIRRACSCGREHPLLTGECAVTRDAARLTGDYLASKGFRRPLIVADENTVRYADRLLAVFRAKTTVVAGNAHATEVWTARVGEAVGEERPDVLVACGSGSVHDITRYVACERGLPFVSYPTAASVDGFVSGVAAMTWHGQKLTFPSVPPLACFADPTVFARAPERLIASGVGDVLGKYTALFDWRVGQILTGEPVCEEIFSLMAEAVDAVVAAVETRAAIGEEAYAEQVMNGLLISGLAIQLNETSRPASGAEHHLSHLWEMRRLNPSTDGLHGEQVAVGLLLASETYRAALNRGIDWEKAGRPDVARVMDRDLLAPVFRELTDGILGENLPDGTLSSSSLSHIRTAPDTDERIREAAAILPPPEKLRAILNAAHTPTAVEELGMDGSEAFAAQSLRFAPYVRNRLTLLKVLSAAGQIG